MSSLCAVIMPRGMTTTVARTNVALTRVPDFSVPLKMEKPSGLGCGFGTRLKRRPAVLLIHKRGLLLAAAQNSAEVDIVRITRTKDGAQIFTFGPVEDSSQEVKQNGQVKQTPKQTPPVTAQAEPPPPAPRSKSSGYKKRSSVTKRPARKSVPSSNPQEEEPSPEPSRPTRLRSGFAKRSPIPHSSSRTPVSESTNTPVAVSPTVTPARGGVSWPSAGARLTGVRERTEAPIPTQDRLRPKSQFVRQSPITSGGRKPRAAAPDSADEQPSTSAAPAGSARARSTFSKRSPIAAGKNARRLKTVAETTEPQAADSVARPVRPSSSFKKPTLALGSSARRTPGARAPEKAVAEENDRLKRPGTAFKRASPISATGRGARKPGLRVIQDLTGIATNGVAKAAEKMEHAIGGIVGSVSGGYSESETESEDESDYEGLSGDSDLRKMKLKQLRQLAKERKIKGMWSMKKAELIGALEVSYSEDV